jgi:tetratricopeptide (TPR) repeat protein
MAEDSIGVRIRRLARAGSHDVSIALAWWGARRDTTALRAVLDDARRRLTSAQAGYVARLTAAYDIASTLAHLALARRDTAEALRRFRALPDTLCVRCYADRLTRAKLLAAKGRHSEALAELEHSLLSNESPFEALFAHERGRVAERLGQREKAAEAYQFVVDAWRHGDPEVRPYVEDARRGLARLRARSP